MYALDAHIICVFKTHTPINFSTNRLRFLYMENQSNHNDDIIAITFFDNVFFGRNIFFY